MSFFDCTPALEYIRIRGYASYSSLKNVRDCEYPKKMETTFFNYGTELHKKFLQDAREKNLTPFDEAMLEKHLHILHGNKTVSMIMQNAKCEVEFNKKILGVETKGYIDILGKNIIADLKTTSTNTMSAFVEQMDFMQPALYMLATGKKDFYYIGISKKPPYKLFVFNVKEYPVLVDKAKKDLEKSLKKVYDYLKNF